MFGYACDETPELMAAPIHYAHQILKTLSEARRAGGGRLNFSFAELAPMPAV